MFRIIPDYLDEAITKKLDEAIAKHPDAEKDRAVLRSQLLDAVDKYGYIPDFDLGRVR